MRTSLALLLFLTLACSSTDDRTGGQASAGAGASTGGVASASGGSGGASSGGSTGASGANGNGTSETSGLPVPSTPGGVMQPMGSPGNLKVLPWAGFTAALSYSFDDAQPSQIAHWAELKAEGIRGTFYLNTQLEASEAGFDATWQDAEAQGWELGNHTVHHCNADGTCSNGAVFTTIDEEFDDVTTYIKTTGHQADVWTAAYPFGDTGYEAAAKERFLLARGVAPGLIGVNDATDAFNLPCIAAIAAGGEAASTFSADIDGARMQGKWLVFLFHSIMPTDQMWYAPTDIASITGSIDHAKSLADVWIDSVVNVGAYWIGQKLIASAPLTMDAGSTTWSWTLPAHFPSGKYLRVTVDGGTLSQGGTPLVWDDHGYYEAALDAGSLTLAP
ncbi:MAG TPA: polysaccharide deacetylase family protein [Polyangiaceae bacterium]